MNRLYAFIFTILSHPEIIGEDMILWTMAWEDSLWTLSRVYDKGTAAVQCGIDSPPWRRQTGSQQNECLSLGFWCPTVGLRVHQLTIELMPTGARTHSHHRYHFIIVYRGHLGKGRDTVLSQWWWGTPGRSVLDWLNAPLSLLKWAPPVKTGKQTWLSSHQWAPLSRNNVCRGPPVSSSMNSKDEWAPGLTALFWLRYPQSPAQYHPGLLLCAFPNRCYRALNAPFEGTLVEL